ncbi:MAG: GGDEF domain-containing protein [Acidimicrobiales bacterium]
MEEIGGIPVGVAAHLREGVVSLAPDGTIEWANAAAGRLLGASSAELVGTSALERLDDADLERALAGIVFSTTHPEHTAVVPFRVRSGADTWVDVELMSSVIAAPDGDHVVLVLRDASPRRAVSEALATVATGADLDATADWLARVIEARWVGTVAGVVVDGPGGRRVVGAQHWPAGLEQGFLGQADTGAIDLRGGPVVAVVGVDELPDDVAGLARGAGLIAFARALVPDPAGGTAAIVAWFDLPDAARMEFEHGSIELRELLALALERRYHLGRLDHAVRHDALTGLHNRSGFLEVVEAAAGRDGTGDALAAQAALLYVDLDGFKPVNDRHGHAVGDAVLRVVGGRLAALSGSWLAARIGGDEFVLFGAGGDDLADRAGVVAQQVVEALTEPIEVGDADGELVVVEIGASVGVAVTDGADVDRLLELADGAMYSVKAAGGRSWSTHLPG